MARLQAVQYAYLQELQGQEGAPILGQQVWYYILETEQLILKERKRRSIPGAVVEQSNALFNQEDLKRDKQVLAVNQAGYTSPLPDRTCHAFPPLQEASLSNSKV